MADDFNIFGTGSGFGSGPAGAAGSIAGALSGAATGNPIALIAGVAGIATSLFGTSEEAKAQKEEAAVSSDIATQQMAIDQQRQQLATLQYNRQSIQNYRQAAQARAKSSVSGVQSGAGPGSSGRIAGVEQATAEQAFNQLNLNQSYGISQNIFGLTQAEDADKIRLAQLGGDAATGAGIAAFGNSLTSGAMALGRLSGGFGGSY